MSKNYEIECALVELEKDLIELKSKKRVSKIPGESVKENENEDMNETDLI